MFKGGTAAAGATAEQDLPLSYARTLSWLSLLVIMATSLVLSFFIESLPEMQGTMNFFV